MKRSILFVALVVVHCFAAFSVAEPIRPEKTIELFDGKSLDAFYSWLVDTHEEDPLRVFTVADRVDGASAIRISGEAWGGIVTKEEYQDYHLIVEFRWGPVTSGSRKTRTRDSGVLVHCQGENGNSGQDFNGPWMRSIEAQIIEGGTGDFILVGGYEQDGNRIVPTMSATVSKDRDGESVYDPNGEVETFTGGRINWFGRDPDWRDVLGFRGGADVESPFGEWTRLEVICDGDSITNIVNGHVVNVGTKASFDSGKIMIQSEGAEIYFRRIELLPLAR